MLFRTICLTTTLLFAAPGLTQDPPAQYSPSFVDIPLWPNGAPGVGTRGAEAEVARDYWVRNIHRPSIVVFPARPDQRNGAAVIVFPGGGHQLLVWTNEGTKVATALNRMGLSVFVVKYRLANEAGSPYSVDGDAADDARRAVRWVRAQAAHYSVDPARVGVMGFSAGR